MTFDKEIEQNTWDDITRSISEKTPEDVCSALSPGTMDIEKFISLVSPAADDFIEEIAQRAQLITEQRFGRIVGLYAPMYLSNSCTNSCLYCSFNASNPIDRLLQLQRVQSN
jgi:2-iminoacetate synthase